MAGINTDKLGLTSYARIRGFVEFCKQRGTDIETNDYLFHVVSVALTRMLKRQRTMTKEDANFLVSFLRMVMKKQSH